MYFETAGTFSTTKTNPVSGAVGLIQFTRDKAGVNYKTIGGLKYDLDVIKSMSFEEQLNLVYLYLKPYKDKIESYTDLYLAVFFPLALGKPDDYLFQTSNLSASLIAQQNPIFDNNPHDNKIYKHEVTDYFAKYYKENFSLINFKKKSDMQTLKNFMTNSPVLSAVVCMAVGFLIGMWYFKPKKR
ncbi:hypothetical protein [Flavobacterium sp. XGLA_31]|uniref:hypothetical protein n=1 Tax=Flavobacterium sp. XGLA_31 TaxID=3447666 RepID=UPI003F40AD7E